MYAQPNVGSSSLLTFRRGAGPDVAGILRRPMVALCWLYTMSELLLNTIGLPVLNNGAPEEQTPKAV